MLRVSALVLLLPVSAAFAQSVVSVRSGVLNFSEGAVFIDNKPVVAQPGKFPVLHDGSDLLTQDGRAEILLTPEVYLRVGANSGVRMISGAFSDTKVEVLSGSVIFDSGNAKAGPAVTLLASGAQIRVDQPTRLRIDSDAAQIRVEKGTALVHYPAGESKVAAGQVFSLTGGTIVRRMNDTSEDDLDFWSQQRNRLIFLSMTANQGIMDPADPNYTGASDASLDPGLNPWVGYIGPASLPPLLPGYYPGAYPGYGYGYGISYGLYPPGLYPPGYGYGGLYGGLYGGGLYRGVYGLRSTGPGAGALRTFHPMPVYRYTPITPGNTGVFTPRPVGGVRIGGPTGVGGAVGGGIAAPRPVTRPVAPPRAAPIHR